MGNWAGYNTQWDQIAKPGKKSHEILTFERSNGLQKFATYYRDGNTAFMTHEVDFDSSGNLLRHKAFAGPDFYSAGKLTDSYSKQKNEHNSYFADYEYTDTDSQPRMLRRLVHSGTVFNPKVYYKVHYTLELVNQKPKQEIERIPAFNIKNGMNIINWNTDKKKKRRDRELKWMQKIFDRELPAD